jgi:hypothetical protein
MPYNAAIQTEARYVHNLGVDATEDRFHGIYTSILLHWFPTRLGYIVEPQVCGDGGTPEFIIVRHLGSPSNPVLIVELKRPSQWTAAWQQAIVDELVDDIEGRFDHTMNNTIYGLGGIGLHWMVCKMQKSGDHLPTTVLDWQDNIASDASYTKFETIADLVYNLA